MRLAKCLMCNKFRFLDKNGLCRKCRVSRQSVNKHSDYEQSEDSGVETVVLASALMGSSSEFVASEVVSNNFKEEAFQGGESGGGGAGRSFELDEEQMDGESSCSCSSSESNSESSSESDEFGPCESSSSYDSGSSYESSSSSDFGSCDSGSSFND